MGTGIPKTGAARRQIYTISELTSEIRDRLERAYPFVWVTGEIGNFSAPGSGHFYFSLKDENAQIAAVMFRGQNRQLKFRPESGMKITGFGRISVYPPRGSYQLVLEYLEPMGTGSLQLAFAQLKARLAAEGLFDTAHKRPLPLLPRKITLVTSPSGAVIHDMIKVLQRRYPNLHIEIAPVRVQGSGAALEMIEALASINKIGDSDVILLARGGGSIEDLAEFNDENLARAIFSSTIPVISAVGHETDFTIADFVADLRASTPTAAAERVVPDKSELIAYTTLLQQRAVAGFRRYLERLLKDHAALSLRLVHPRRRLDDHRIALDDAVSRLQKRYDRLLQWKQQAFFWTHQRLSASYIRQELLRGKKEQKKSQDRLHSAIRLCLNTRQSELEAVTLRLLALSPLSVLERGFAVARTLPDQSILMDASAGEIGGRIEVQLACGRLICRIEEIASGEENL